MIKKCARCGTTINVHGNAKYCIKCRDEVYREQVRKYRLGYYAANRERMRERRREYYATHRKEILARDHERYVRKKREREANHD